MPFVTQIPANLITISNAGTIASIPQTSIGNFFGTSQQFNTYDVGPAYAGNDSTLTNGESVALLQGTTPVTSGIYRGTAQLTNGAVNVSVGLASINLAFNPVSGHVIQGPGNTAQFITDQPVGAARLGVTATVTILGQTFQVSGPISGIANQIADRVAQIPIGGAAAAIPIRAGQGLIQGAANGAIINFTGNPNNSFVLPPGSVVCFVAGTMIETSDGLAAVETLKAGDLIATKDRGFQPVRWAGQVRVSAAMLQAMPNLRPIRIRAGALGRGTPARDLLVSPQHRVLVASSIANDMFAAKEVLIAAKHLVGVAGIELAMDVTEIVYCHFLCDDHEIVYSNGAETETMFTGEVALRSVSQAARQEIFSLFPHLAEPDHRPQPVRPFVNGRQSRALAKKHTVDPRELT